MALISEAQVSTTTVVIKFRDTPKPSSITNDKFTVATVEATPVTLVDPFETINITDDYNSISKVLVLYWVDGVLDPNTTYEITIAGLIGAAATVLDTEVIEFTTEDSVAIDVTELPSAEPTITIEDHSIVSDAFTDLLITSTSTVFALDTSDPVDGDYYLPADYNDGRITLTFTDTVSAASVTTTNFRVQKKELSRLPSRWEDVEIEISSSDTEVYIDLPSIDHYPEAATPSDTVVYHTADYEYISENYKYRVLISSSVMADAATPTDSLAADVEVAFAGVLDPLYVNPDELVAIFPDASELEIAEALWMYSTEVKEVLSLGDDATPAFIVSDYVKAAAACSLSRIYTSTMGDETTFRLGDLSITSRAVAKSKITRANATTWCEWAAVLRREMLATKSRMRAVVAGSDHPNPIPVRKFRNYDSGTRSIRTLDNPPRQGNLDTYGPS